MKEKSFFFHYNFAEFGMNMYWSGKSDVLKLFFINYFHFNINKLL